MSFPQTPLDARVELNLAGTWTAITSYALQREGTSPPVTITRGRPDETSKATPSTCAMQWNNRDGRFSPRNPVGPYYGVLGRNTPLRVSVPDSGVYLRLADDATSGATTPDSAGLQITGSLDVRFDADLDNWVPSVLCSKWGSTGHAWALSLNDDGSVTLTWFDGTSNHQVSCSGLAVMPLGRSMIRATLNASTGTVQFLTAANMGATETVIATIPGSGATSVNAAAGQAVSVGDAASFDASFGTQGCQGKIYEFRVYNGIGGTLEASPKFSAQTAGAGSFTDGQSNTWTLNGTATLSGRSFLGHFECSSLPQQWDTSGTDVWTPVQASGVTRRLQQGSAPLRSVMRRGIPAWPSVPSANMTSLSSLPSTLAYWPCEDAAGSTQIAPGITQNSDGVTVAPMAVAGTAGFQGTAGSPSADSAFASSAQIVQIQSSTWTGRIPAYSSHGTAAMVTFLIAIPSGGLPGSPGLLPLVQANYSGSGVNQLLLEYGAASGGGLNLITFNGSTFTVIGTITGVNGNAYMVQLLNVSTGTPAAYMFTMQLGPGHSGTTTTGASIAAGQLTSVVVNPSAGNCGATEIGHIWAEAAFSSSGSQDALPGLSDPNLQNLFNAYQGEPAGTRFARLCAENGIAGRVYGYPAVTAAMGPQQIDTLMNILQSCEDADRGFIYEPAEALGAGYRTNASLCNQAPAVTLSYPAQDLGGDGGQGLTPSDDDQYTVNDVTATRNGGSSYQYQVTSGTLSTAAPPAGVGDYATALTVYCAYDAQLPQIAAWIAHVGTTDQERYPVIPLNLARTQLTSLIYQIQDVRLGARLEVTSPPAWLPPDTISQLAWGVTEKLGGFFYQLAWNAVPELPWETAVYGAVNGTGIAHYDTAGSQLHAAVTSGAAWFWVDVTAGNAWTPYLADFPFAIRVAGEVMTVNAIGPAGNWLTGADSNFETSLGDWVVNGNCTLVDTVAQAHAGTYSMQMSSVAAGTMSAASYPGGSITALGMPCSAGDTVTASAWVLAASATRSCQVGAQFYNSGGGFISTLVGSGTVDSASAWTQITASLTAPAGAAFARAYVQVDSTGGASEIHYVDDVFLLDATTMPAGSQRFQVTRSVNGVTKAQSSGAAVHADPLPVYALQGAA